jgi:DNA-binding MarR family transcriptional regulator
MASSFVIHIHGHSSHSKDSSASSQSPSSHCKVFLWVSGPRKSRPMATQPVPHTQEDPRPLPTVTDRLVSAMLMILEKTRTRPWRRLGQRDKGSLQESVLRYLATQAGQCATMIRIAAGTGTQPPSATQSVKQLYRKGLVTRRQDPHDHRITLITLSTRGRKTVKQPASWDKAIRNAYQGLIETEGALLLRYITILEASTLSHVLPRRAAWKRVLQYLSTHDHHQTTVATIRTALQMKPAVLKQALKTLEQRGWLIRTADATYVRRQCLQLSPSGEHYAQEERLRAGTGSRPEKNHQAGT